MMTAAGNKPVAWDTMLHTSDNNITAQILFYFFVVNNCTT